MKKPCETCGQEFEARHSGHKTCSPECFRIYRNKYERRVRAGYRVTLGTKWEKTTAHVSKPKYKSPISDEDQLKLNRAVDAKYHIKLESKVYKRNSKEFKAIAALYQ